MAAGVSSSKILLMNVRMNVGVGSQTRAFSTASTKVIARVNPER